MTPLNVCSSKVKNNDAIKTIQLELMHPLCVDRRLKGKALLLSLYFKTLPDIYLLLTSRHYFTKWRWRTPQPRTRQIALPRPSKKASSSRSAVDSKDSIEGEHSSSSFACGGTIPINSKNPEPEGPENTPSDTTRTSPPVRLTWSSEINNQSAQKLTLPLSDTPVSNAAVLDQLVQTCIPASFGRGDQDVLDPSYRQAGKLDGDMFLSSFDPAGFGILQNIEQILLPSLSTEMQNELQFRRIRAELYKLNVLSCRLGHLDFEV